MKRIFDHPWPALLLMLTAVLMLSFFSAPLLQHAEQNIDTVDHPLAASQSLQRVLIYGECGHSSSKELPAAAFQQLSSTALQAAGWQVEEAGSTTRICDVVDGLCPTCSAMLHLRLYQGWLCVYQGPAVAFDETRQPLLRLEFSPAQLPPELQAELSRGAIEFADLEALYAALDSLDEYR